LIADRIGALMEEREAEVWFPKCGSCLRAFRDTKQSPRADLTPTDTFTKKKSRSQHQGVLRDLGQSGLLAAAKKRRNMAAGDVIGTVLGDPESGQGRAKPGEATP
jgi:hypothetical protein